LSSLASAFARRLPAEKSRPQEGKATSRGTSADVTSCLQTLRVWSDGTDVRRRWKTLRRAKAPRWPRLLMKRTKRPVENRSKRAETGEDNVDKSVVQNPTPRLHKTASEHQWHCYQCPPNSFPPPLFCNHLFPPFVPRPDMSVVKQRSCPRTQCHEYSPNSALTPQIRRLNELVSRQHSGDQIVKASHSVT